MENFISTVLNAMFVALSAMWPVSGIAGGIWFARKRRFTLWGLDTFPPDLWLLLGWTLSGPIGLLIAWLVPRDPQIRL